MKLMQVIIVIGLAVNITSANAMFSWFWPSGEKKQQENKLTAQMIPEQKTQQDCMLVDQETTNKFFQYQDKIRDGIIQQDDKNSATNSEIMDQMILGTRYYQFAKHPTNSNIYAHSGISTFGNDDNSIMQPYVCVTNYTKQGDDRNVIIKATLPQWYSGLKPLFNYDGSIISFECIYDQKKYRNVAVRLCNMAKKITKDLSIPQSIEYSCAWSKLKNLLAVNCLSQKIHVYHIDDQTLDASKQFEVTGGGWGTTEWNPKNNNLVVDQAADEKNRSLVLYDEKGTKINGWKYSCENFRVWKTQWNEDGTKLAVTGDGIKKAFVLDNKLQQIYEIDTDNSFMCQGNWVKNLLILYGYKATQVHIHDTDEGKDKAVLNIDKPVSSVQINPQGTMVVATQRATFNNLMLWKITGEKIPVKNYFETRFPSLSLDVMWSCDGQDIARNNLRYLVDYFPDPTFCVTKLKDLIGQENEFKREKK